MLVIPVAKNFKKSFPYVTLALIIVNVLIFFGLQLDENRLYSEAISYYQSADLLSLEGPFYEQYLQRKNETLSDDLKGEKLFWTMFNDDVFQYELEHRTLVSQDDPQFEDWLDKRETFENKLNQIVSRRFGYSPIRKNYLGAFTCMFLHGGLMHLLGNMVFLWFVGSLLEIGIGRWYYYLFGYLLTGVVGSLAFGAVYPTAQGPLVGASGAIAGLMGAYGLLYARTKIKVFYSLGFYFDYATLPGWILFPFWIGKEIFQLASDTNSQVAYMAHIGGLLSGAILGLIFLVVHKEQRQIAEEMFKEEPESEVPALLEQGLQYMSELKMDEAREKMNEVLELEPKNLVALTHLFHIDKCTPESEQFHLTAAQLLKHLTKIKDYEELTTRFNEYKKLSGSPRLRPPLILALSKAKLHAKNPAGAAKLLMILLKKQPQHPGVSSCLFNIGCTFHKQGEKKQAAQCFRLICKQYPSTSIAGRAKEELNRL